MSDEYLDDPFPEADKPYERSLPHNSETERAILGGILLDNALMPQAVELVKNPYYFFIPSHQKIYAAMVTLFEKGSEINPILIGNELRKENALEAAGGFTNITGLTYGLPHTSNLIHYLEVLRGNYTLRSLIKASAAIIEEAQSSDSEPQVTLGNAHKLIFDISLESTNKTFSTIGSLAHARMLKAWEAKELGSTLTGLDTGFIEFNQMTLGLQRSDLIIIAARPSMGKTGFATMLAQNAALLTNAHVAFFSLEMSKESLAMRFLCQNARVDTRRFALGYLSDPEWHLLGDAEQSLQECRIHIDDTPAITPLAVKSKCMRLAAEHGPLDLIVVDYLQLMTGSAKKFELRQQEVSRISNDLKSIAKELNTPVVALSQLNRSPETRTDHRPQLADLRESGSLEQDADLVGLLYRSDKYKPASEVHDNICELDIAKQRNGPTGVVNLRFDEPSTRFDNLEYSGS